MPSLPEALLRKFGCDSSAILATYFYSPEIGFQRRGSAVHVDANMHIIALCACSDLAHDRFVRRKPFQNMNFER